MLSAQRGSFCFSSEPLLFFNVSMRSITNYVFPLFVFISYIHIYHQTLLWNGKCISKAEGSRWLCWEVHTVELHKVHFLHLRFHTNEENRMWLPTAEASSNPLQGEKFEFLNVKRLFWISTFCNSTEETKTKTMSSPHSCEHSAPEGLMPIYLFPLLLRAVPCLHRI